MRVASVLALIALVALVALVGCRPALDEQVSLVDGPRVLAVSASPPEAAPGESVALSALVVDDAGVVVDPGLAWGLCRFARAATDTGALPTSCIDGEVDALAGDAATIETVVPDDACAVFGPDSTAGTRPPDPDVTGGYFLPVRVDRDDTVTAFGAVRLSCRLGDADVDVARAYDERYEDNRAPDVDVVLPSRIAAGATVDVDVSWAAGDAEDFVVYDRAAQALLPARESIVASFFATAGAFSVERSGRAEDDRATTASSRWRAPDEPGVAHVWVIVRDGRGAVVWREVEVAVEQARTP